MCLCNERDIKREREKRGVVVAACGGGDLLLRSCRSSCAPPLDRHVCLAAKASAASVEEVELPGGGVDLNLWVCVAEHVSPILLVIGCRGSVVCVHSLLLLLECTCDSCDCMYS